MDSFDLHHWQERADRLIRRQERLLKVMRIRSARLAEFKAAMRREVERVENNTKVKEAA